MADDRSVLRREILMDKPYLHIPIEPGKGGDCLLRVFLGRYLLHTFRVKLTADCPTYFPLELPECEGKTICIEAALGSPDNAAALDRIVCGGRPEDERVLYPALYHEPHRPRFHFSCKRGWLNDPNGLFYAGGLWHLYFQHNPLGTGACDRNCSWGHAVSDDLFHWKERRPAIMPHDDYTMCASGSCLPDTKNALGYGADAVLAAYSVLGASRMTDWKLMPSKGQYFAVSIDGGDSFLRLPEPPGIPCERGESWRDPCLFGDENGYGAAVYEYHDGKHMVAFYRSGDLKTWERTGFAPELFECPDMFPLTCEETGETRWALHGGDGAIRVGRYDGGVFGDEESRNPLDFGRAVYAGQTFRCAPDGRRVHIAWACGMGDHRIWDERGMGYEGLPFSQCMTTPCELRLRRLNGRYFVSRTPVRELENMRLGDAVPESVGDALPLKAGSEYQIAFGENKAVSFSVADLAFAFCHESGVVTFPNGNTLAIDGRALRARLLIDETTVEIFLNDLACATYTMPVEEAVLRVADGDAAIVRYPLKNIHAVDEREGA